VLKIPVEELGNLFLDGSGAPGSRENSVKEPGDDVFLLKIPDPDFIHAIPFNPIVLFS
jgi:hypothetical protein